MIFKSNTLSSIGAVVFCAVWVWLTRSQEIAENLWLGIPVITIFFAISCFALYRLSRAGLKLNPIAMAVCTLTLVLLMFTAWGQTLGNLPALALPEIVPRPIRIAVLFVPGLVSAAVVTILFAYPLAVLLHRFAWLVPALASAMAVALQYESLVDTSGHPLTRILLFYELACLLVLVPLLYSLLLSMARRLSPQIHQERVVINSARFAELGDEKHV